MAEEISKTSCDAIRRACESRNTERYELLKELLSSKTDHIAEQSEHAIRDIQTSLSNGRERMLSTEKKIDEGLKKKQDKTGMPWGMISSFIAVLISISTIIGASWHYSIKNDVQMAAMEAKFEHHTSECQKFKEEVEAYMEKN